MQRLLTTLALAMPFLVLGAPVCCAVESSCCHIPPQPDREAPCCPSCPQEKPAPEPVPEPAPQCDCSDHPVLLAPAEKAPVDAPVLAVAAAPAIDAEPPLLVLALVPEAAATPPLALSALSLPLLE